MLKERLIRWLIFMVIICLMTVNFTFITNAEETQIEEAPLIHYVIVDENGFNGHIFTDKAGYYIRSTLFIGDSFYLIIIVPVNENGVWELLTEGNIKHATFQVVDRPDAFIPGEYIVYDSIAINLID